MKQKRLILVDALRGFALLLIILIHSVEHFEFFTRPSIDSIFTSSIDETVMDWTFLLVGGKAYSIFALLFGLSFFIQMNNKAKLGVDFRLGFLWRMVILFLIGFVHSLIYRGDILHMYALFAIPMILLFRLPVKTLFVVAGLLLLQLPAYWQLQYSFAHPDDELTRLIPSFFKEGNQVYATGSFWEVIQFNSWKGRLTVWSWTIKNGRYLQLMGLFILGLILGRKRVFQHLQQHLKLVWGLLVLSMVAYFWFGLLLNYINQGEWSDVQKRIATMILESYINLAATFVYCSIFTLAYYRFPMAKAFKLLAAYGKLSLTNYTSQAVLGVVLFYHFGLGWYQYVGAVWSIFFGLSLFLIQGAFSIYWNRRFQYGPIEWLWRCATERDFSIPIRRSCCFTNTQDLLPEMK